jgi:hypothetical protein
MPPPSAAEAIEAGLDRCWATLGRWRHLPAAGLTAGGLNGILPGLPNGHVVCPLESDKECNVWN